MVDYINDNGGIASMNGAKIEVVYGDNTSDTTVCVTVADRVFSDESVMFALGAGSSTLLLPMLPSVEKYQVPILTTTPRIPSPSRAIGMSSAAISRAPRKPVKHLDCPGRRNDYWKSFLSVSWTVLLDYHDSLRRNHARGIAVF